jgi:hypothetical protein
MIPMNPNAPRHRGGPVRRLRRPAVEALESRELLTSHPLGPTLPGRHYPAPDVQQFVPILYPPGTPQPTAAEIQRQSFDFKGIGRYTIGPGRFSDQSITIHGFGKPGTSNQSRKMHFQFFVAEPSSSSPSQLVYGNLNFVAGNFLQNSSDLIIDFIGPKGSEMNGLPTHLYWTSDVNQSSSGPFAETGTAFPGRNNFPASYFNAQGVPTSPLSQGLPPASVDYWGLSLGDANFKYIPDAHPVKGSLGSGTVIVTMRGLMNNSGAQSQIDKNIN